METTANPVCKLLYEQVDFIALQCIDCDRWLDRPDLAFVALPHHSKPISWSPFSQPVRRLQLRCSVSGSPVTTSDLSFRYHFYCFLAWWWPARPLIVPTAAIPVLISFFRYFVCHDARTNQEGHLRVAVALAPRSTLDSQLRPYFEFYALQCV